MTQDERDLLLFLGRASAKELQRHVAYLNTRSGPDSERLARDGQALVVYVEKLIGRVAAGGGE
ncbi:hypothetical protein [Roseomonas xinghualingensis]|uniref:hypothetical protein n=1 Tax=Roseomonas xinghualingensis TaxID=2986475 RepID=UPI0021F0FB26|nr:hypothetical protein [Roseomonas sp. SXEYE001]MCV4208592.1 hypothetical protein [Roseomonas sp. SXEYE001]MCV4210080.1 hypothetical protein [Roseomonas sp. SXEYE001]